MAPIPSRPAPTERGYTASSARLPVPVCGPDQTAHYDVEHRSNVLTTRLFPSLRAVAPHRRDEAVPLCCRGPTPCLATCRSALLAVTLLGIMPSAPGHTLPLEFDHRWRRQVSSSTSNEDTPRIAPFTSGGTHSEFSTNSDILQTSSRTVVQISLWSIGNSSPTRTNSFAGPSDATSPSDTGTRTTEFSGLPIPSLATESQSSSLTVGQGSSFLEPLPSSGRSRSYTSRRITIIPTFGFPSPISRTTSPTRAAFPSSSSPRPHLPLYTDPSLSPSFTLSASTASFTTTLTTFLPIISTVWMSVPTTTTITVTSSSPTSIPSLIPTMSTSLSSSISSSSPSPSSDPFSASVSPTTPPSSASSSSSLSGTSYPSSITDSLSASSSTSTSVLPQTTTPITVFPTTRTTLYTTVVKTYTTVSGGRTIIGTSTEVVPTDTLMPGGGGNGNIFAHDKGALAGLVLGCIALTGLVAALGLFAYRRHRARSAQNLDAVTALRGGPGGPRALMLDEDDDDSRHIGGMTFLGTHPVSRTSGGARYALLHGGNNLEGAAEDGNMRRQDVSEGRAVALPPIPTLRGLAEEMEDAVLMHPANRSEHDIVAESGSSPRLQAPPSVGNSSSGTRSGSAVWLGGPVMSSPEVSTTGYFDSTSTHSLPPRPMSPSSVYSDDVMSAHPDSHSIMGAIGTYVSGEQLPYGGHDRYAPSSTYGHDAARSSCGGHGSLNDDKIGGSLSGDVPSTTTHSSHLLIPRPVPVSAPSSLLPTKTAPHAASPTVCRDGSKRGFIGRSLRSLRFRSAPSGLLSSVAAGASSLAAVDSATKQQALDGPSSSQHASIARPQPPTLSPTPRPLLRSERSMPEGAAPHSTPESSSFSLGTHARTASGAPAWPGISAVPCRSSAPSPALTEGSTRTPDGLLNPKWVNNDGMRSRGALSFRDDMDYSRPIGGLVNNRQYSYTSLETMLSATPDRRRSLESDQTDRAHTQAVPMPPEEEDAASPRYEDMSWPAPSIEVTPPSATLR
ncbi:hypothetical protein GSI_10515 [Ganoderma sinense ZZ0214-1]|uniref:Uncharacterized protein n=1 Tax=Ganoderma sinense ZZ0214-1 TaxID=1077348 RepID=A0A2G8S1D6_9APHY|nr:hypothetical protein GSI_10515 [Ganoderma sinense ZZ0214-1]